MPITPTGDPVPTAYYIPFNIGGVDFYAQSGPGPIGDEEDTDTAAQKLVDLLSGSPDVSFVGGNKSTEQANAITATEE